MLMLAVPHGEINMYVCGVALTHATGSRL